MGYGMGGAGKALEAQGRNGDTILAHITPREAMMLKMRGGAGSINPRTGLLEFWDDGGNDPGGVGGEAGSGAAGGPGDPSGSGAGEEAMGTASQSAAEEAAAGMAASGDDTVSPTDVDSGRNAVGQGRNAADIGGPSGPLGLEAPMGTFMDTMGVHAAMGNYAGMMRDSLGRLSDTVDELNENYPTTSMAIKSVLMLGLTPAALASTMVQGMYRGATSMANMSDEERGAVNSSLASSMNTGRGEGAEQDFSSSEGQYVDIPASASAGRIVMRDTFDKNLGISQKNKVRVIR